MGKGVGENRLVAPGDREGLRKWAELFCGIHLAREAVCAGHSVPLEYLEYVFFEGKGNWEGYLARGEEEEMVRDPVIWACRGGGKTMVGAVATLLDLLFKPGVQVRILGGSREQSEKMYTYLCGLVRGHFMDQVKGAVRRRGFLMKNGSGVEILAQSARAVRGVRVQKVRCDEIELFDREVWKAAQLTTRSLMREEKKADGEKEGKVVARGSVEVFSTMHKVGGMMQEICMVEGGGVGMGGSAAPRKVFTWCIFDVMGRCHARRACEKCALFGECGGRVKRADGFVPLADVVAMKARVARNVWENEMLCYLPHKEDRVFEAFTHKMHVREFSLGHGQPEPGETRMAGQRVFRLESVVAGVDFGWRQFVCLWIAMMRDEQGRRVVWVMDEYVQGARTLEANALAMRERPVNRAEGEPWKPGVVYCDVAGRQKDAHSGQTSEAVLRKLGFAVRSSAMEVEDGIGRILELIDPAMEGPKKEGDGTEAGEMQRFFVNAKCGRMIEALEGYSRRKDGKPEKDGKHDHLIDALRYAVVNHDRRGTGSEDRGY